MLSAAVLVLMIASNRAGVQTATSTQITSEVIGVVMAVILFIQGIAEAFPSSSSGTSTTATISTFLTVIQSAPKSLQLTSVETAARSVIQTCEDVSYVLIISNTEKKVILELGPVSGKAATKKSCEILSGFSGRNAEKNEKVK